MASTKARLLKHDFPVHGNSETFQDGNGNGNLGEIDSSDFQDGNWEPMQMKGSLRTPRRQRQSTNGI